MPSAPRPCPTPTVHQFTQIPPSETWGLAFAPPAAGEGGDAKLLLAVAGGSSNSVRLLDVTAKEQVRRGRVLGERGWKSGRCVAQLSG